MSQCCEQLEPGLAAMHRSFEHAALNGMGIRLKPLNFCPWCGTRLTKDVVGEPKVERVGNKEKQLIFGKDSK